MITYLTIGSLIGFFLLLMYDATIKQRPYLIGLGLAAPFVWPLYILLPLAYLGFRMLGAFLDWLWLIYWHPVHPHKPEAY